MKSEAVLISGRYAEKLIVDQNSLLPICTVQSKKKEKFMGNYRFTEQIPKLEDSVFARWLYSVLSSQC